MTVTIIKIHNKIILCLKEFLYQRNYNSHNTSCGSCIPSVDNEILKLGMYLTTMLSYVFYTCLLF